MNEIRAKAPGIVCYDMQVCIGTYKRSRNKCLFPVPHTCAAQRSFSLSTLAQFDKTRCNRTIIALCLLTLPNGTFCVFNHKLAFFARSWHCFCSACAAAPVWCWMHDSFDAPFIILAASLSHTAFARLSVLCSLHAHITIDMPCLFFNLTNQSFNRHWMACVCVFIEHFLCSVGSKPGLWAHELGLAFKSAMTYTPGAMTI